MAGTEKLLEQREQTHGKYCDVSRLAQSLRASFRLNPRWWLLPPEHRESLDMMASKIARIVSGNPNEKDHWQDIEGYARLVLRAIERRDA